MAQSKNVLAVMGLLCVNRTFREQFFANPRHACARFVGDDLSSHELEQIEALGGHGCLPAGRTRVEFVSQAQNAFDQVYVAYLCPMRPCPDPDPDDEPEAS